MNTNQKEDFLLVGWIPVDAKGNLCRIVIGDDWYRKVKPMVVYKHEKRAKRHSPVMKAQPVYTFELKEDQ